MAQPYDLLVIGGGVNGLGIAADAAARGLSVVLVERGDIGSGTTATSSRLIHGGLRYLQYGELALVHESLRERGLLARQRPHLVQPIELLIPVYAGQTMPGWMIGTGLTLYDVLARDKRFAHPSPLTHRQMTEREPSLNPVGLKGGFIYPDAQIAFPERLCVELAQEIVAAGGEVRTYAAVEGLRTEGFRVVGATLAGGETIHARMTVNAAGPWVDAVNCTLGTPPPTLIGGTWGSHLVLPCRDNGPRGHLYATARKDGRPFFVLPWDGRLLVGTTDVKLGERDPDAVAVEDWERTYLLEELGHLFPNAGYGDGDIEATTVGVRPLPASGKSAGAVTRRHFLVDHAKTHGIPGLASVVGGKLTTYRSLAEDVVDQAIRLLSMAPRPCTTATVVDPPDVAALTLATGVALDRLGAPVAAAPRLVALYGSAVTDVVRRMERNPALGRPLVSGGIDLQAQVVHAAKAELARSPEDIVRRRLVRLGAQPELTAAVAQSMKTNSLTL